MTSLKFKNKIKFKKKKKAEKKKKEFYFYNLNPQKSSRREFPNGPVIRTLEFSLQGLGSIPSQGTKIPQVAQYSQKKKKFSTKC